MTAQIANGKAQRLINKQFLSDALRLALCALLAPIPMIHKSAIKSYIIPAISMLAFAILTQSRLLQISGVNPNLVLAALAAFAIFLPNFLLNLSLAVLGALLLKSIPVFEFSSLGLIAAACVAWALARVSPWRPTVGAAIIAIVGTLVFYGVGNYQFIISAPAIFLEEAAYNAFSAATLYVVLGYLYD